MDVHIFRCRRGGDTRAREKADGVLLKNGPDLHPGLGLLDKLKAPRRE